MARRRRKARISPSRSPSGRLSRAGEPPEFAPTLVKRLRDAAIARMDQAEWGSELGRLFLTHRIEAPMYAAGRKWAELVARYHVATAAPFPDPKPAPLKREGHGFDVDVDSAIGQKRARRDRDIVHQMQAASAALSGAGSAATAAVRLVCERDGILVGQLERQALYRGLSTLADFFGLTAKPRGDRPNGHKVSI